MKKMFGDPNVCYHKKINLTVEFFKDAGGMASSADTDQSVPVGAV